MKPFAIGSRFVGPGHPTLVIAEIGVNHDGSVQKALDLVRIAAGCGADAVKLQIFRATTLMHATAGLATYQQANTSDARPIDMLRRYELAMPDLRRIVQEIRERKMIPLATPFSPTDLEAIEALRLPAIKIASPDLVNHPLLSAAARIGKPLLVSTGAAEMAEVDTSVGWLRERGAEFALLHCISSYPTPASQANLSWIIELAKRFDVPVGYSDHTTEVVSGALAAAAGATVIERHLTYDRAAKGPDHSASSDPTQFERYVKLVREADTMRGTQGKRVLDIELDVRLASRQSLVARRALKAGEVLREEDVTVQRPGTGLPAAQITQAIGLRVQRPVTAGSLLQWDMFSDAA
ncbi:MAG: putative sialic acid synthase [Phycisphaerales bacterium]|nr:putative sialic acid synthase [Phycisphaerales bacterium]MDB5299831.1 putative sialic acid synthase [Phycisphaerales bacterium]MDB5302550.1 putative sialic acid synthase [Phycisphaerales bacterium]